MAEHFPPPWRMDPHSFSIYAQDVPKGPARVADMRGWGYLTGKGHGALALPEALAIETQKANAAFIVKAVNNHDALVKGLERIIDADTTVSDGGKVHDHGPWATIAIEALAGVVGAPK